MEDNYFREYNRKYRKTEPGRLTVLKAQKKYRAKNKEKVAQYQHDYYLTQKPKYGWGKKRKRVRDELRSTEATNTSN